MTEFVMPVNQGRRNDMLAKMIRFAHKLDAGKAWRWSVEPYKKRRSNQQNAYLWGVCYSTIMEEGSEELRGWAKDDLHEFFLGEHFGWETTEGFGRKRLKPLRRSSKLSTMEFVDYVDSIQRFMALRGVYIPDPNEFVEV